MLVAPPTTVRSHGNVFSLPSATDSPPATVAQTVALLQKRGIWFLLGRNQEARSCRDAANRRTRLGATGIPLWDELKSYLGIARDADGTEQYVFVHCRGDRRINLDRVADAINAVPRRLSPSALESLGMEYGLVNPFPLWVTEDKSRHRSVVQVFDEDLLTPIGIPGTVMTNAGDLTWSVELRAEELARALDDVVVAEVSEIDPREGARPLWAVSPSALGIIAGTDTAAKLVSLIINDVRHGLPRIARGDLWLPRITVAGVPGLGLVRGGQPGVNTCAALRESALAICGGGADILSVAEHISLEDAADVREIAAQHHATCVTLADSVGGWLRGHHVERLALLAVKPIADLGPHSPYREPLAGLAVEAVDDQTLDRVHELANAVRSHGATRKHLGELRDILRSGPDADVVVLAMSELSLVFETQHSPSRSGRWIIDALRVHAADVAGRYLGHPVVVEMPARNA